MNFWQADINLPSMSPSKDPADDPRFRHTKLVRLAWRLYTQRFTPAGRWFALVSGCFVSYSGTSLQLQGYVPAAYVGGIWLVAFVGLFLWRPRVTITVRVGDRVCAGETLSAQIDVTNQSSWRGGDLALVANRLPRGVDPVPEMGVTLPDLKAGETTTVKVGLKCSKRGLYQLQGWRVESGFPFGILRSRRTFRENRKLLVYPRFSPLHRLNLPTGRRYQPGGVALASELGESFEYLGNREYREGDNVRDIDWRATARVGVPVVREWVEEYMLRVAVILDTEVRKDQPRKTLELRRDSFERAVSVAGSVSDYMARQDYLVDLFAAGPDLYHLTAGRSLAYLEQILDILACVEESGEAPFARIEPALAELLERLSTIILVLLDWDEARMQFAEGLVAQGVAVKVIVVRDGPCTLDPGNASRALGGVVVVSKEDYEAEGKGVQEL